MTSTIIIISIIFIIILLSYYYHFIIILLSYYYYDHSYVNLPHGLFFQIGTCTLPDSWTIGLESCHDLHTMLKWQLNTPKTLKVDV